jgi:hypothetical protein
VLIGAGGGDMGGRGEEGRGRGSRTWWKSGFICSARIAIPLAFHASAPPASE